MELGRNVRSWLLKAQRVPTGSILPQTKPIQDSPVYCSPVDEPWLGEELGL